MASQRALPERKNPLLEPIESTAKDILVERRRLGQTNLGVKSGIAGLTSATKSANTGTFDYAHLRVPLPKDLTGSGIFALNRSSAFPESYFLMRRSSDGYISATGMFKAAFPWASHAEEEAERKFQKSFPSAGDDEVAGSVWIAPEEALSLSEEYAMRHWVEALLDPAPIEKSNKDKANTHIQQPPIFDLENAILASLPSHTVLRTSTRARSTRSVSPGKMATPSRKIATPRKPRTTRGAAKSADDFVESSASKTANALQDMIANGAELDDSVASDSVSGEVKEVGPNEGVVHIEVQETVEQTGDTQTKSTNVVIDVPHNHAELPEPEDPTKMIEEARRMVEEAQKLEAGGSSDVAKLLKRKVEEVVEGEELDNGRQSKSAKMAYTTEQKLTKEKVTRRALVGVFAMAAIGTAFQYLA
ncbi:apses transcription factor-like protein [Ampelomyces quisqualis]|uniref:Apses transcription factor-like protein n=1 Tax=Ampelomyces quisqualis TaxID=50730 RepID=A0A6A5QY45_AMPQU|nr:apses transcription factor-like protein [Ampelomyces quisqualis]